ncbi:hypothetical protein [Nocardia nepalensis]|uniref:hypothetical protein n=1 Tax=Nocardia nepalensis TaxID=3375448 RepID=UPI003B6853C1
MAGLLGVATPGNLNQGRADSDRVSPFSRRLTSWIVSRPTDLPAGRRCSHPAPK